MQNNCEQGWCLIVGVLDLYYHYVLFCLSAVEAVAAKALMKKVIGIDKEYK